jgi:hypothetical protein
VCCINSQKANYRCSTREDKIINITKQQQSDYKNDDDDDNNNNNKYQYYTIILVDKNVTKG